MSIASRVGKILVIDFRILSILIVTLSISENLRAFLICKLNSDMLNE